MILREHDPRASEAGRNAAADNYDRAVDPRHIVAVGGGGTPDAVIDAVLALSPRSQPSVLYVGTASAEDPWLTLKTYDRFRGKAELRHLEFFPWPPEDLRALALAQDVIWVGGGNTANMLAVWRVHGFDRILREAWEQGVVLAGGSAGMICWFEAGVTDSFGPQLAPIECLGFLPGSACPHWDDEGLRRPVYRGLIDGGELPAGYAADSGVGLHFAGTELVEVLSDREGATGYRVEPGLESPLPARML
jgi:dipeptidase E